MRRCAVFADDPATFIVCRVSTPAGSGGGSGGGGSTGAGPEPATWALMILGFGLVGGVVRRRRTTIAFG